MGGAGDISISSDERGDSIAKAAATQANGLYLLFARDKRPNQSALREFANNQAAVSIAHDPAGSNGLQLVAADGMTISKSFFGDETLIDLSWLELLRDGLTFDLKGLAPSEPAAFPQIAHHFDFETTPGPATYEALHLHPGLHLAGGERNEPVVRALLALARDLVHNFDALEAVVWPPAQSVIGRRFFESVSTAWLDGGAFPALGLTAFKKTIDGALQSVGLDYWIGQELRIEAPLSNDPSGATRLGVRLINQLIHIGGIDLAESIIAPDGSRLLLSPSSNGNFIRVTRD